MRTKKWTFTNRWRIEGILIVETPLHIGSGQTTNRPGLIAPDGWTEVNAVTLDYKGRSCIPGTTLKGCLRGWLEGRVGNRPLIDEVFGKDATTADPGAGGKAEFWDARLTDSELKESTVPHWDTWRQTGVEVSVAINRLTRTAREKKLFHQEIVPAGVRFKVIITGQNLNEEEVALLLTGLRGFKKDGECPVLIGADTGSGKGRLRWEEEKLLYFGEAQREAWITRDIADLPMASASDAFEVAPADRIEKINGFLANLLILPPTSLITLDFDLRFSSPFLVNDPPPPSADTEKDQDDQNEPDHRPRTDRHGNALLPAKSFRGVLRAQAERIIRTMGGRACRVDDSKDACPAIEEASQVDRLCLACRVFGAAGWKSPLSISDFTKPELTQEKRLQQWFVAIDRFTGGAAHQKLFGTESALMPVLNGTITLDLGRAERWAVGLLALALRDLVEGDLTFGYGASKGYGSCTATITEGKATGLPDDANYVYPSSTATSLDEGLKARIADCVTEFRNKVKSEGEGKGAAA